MASPTNQIRTNELDFARNVDFVNRFNGGIDKLLALIDVNGVQVLPVGSQIQIWATTGSLNATQAAEGEDIPLTKIERKIATTKSLSFKKYRKSISMEGLQKQGDAAVDKTDSKMIRLIQDGIRGDIITMLGTGTGAIDSGASPNNLQQALAYMWDALQDAFDGEDTDTVTPVFFGNSLDIAEYLGTATISTQEAFGLHYIKNFLGLGDFIIDNKISAGTLYATAKENINVYCADAGSLGAYFPGLYTDETGLVLVDHSPNPKALAYDTVAATGLQIFPEVLSGIIVCSSFNLADTDFTSFSVPGSGSTTLNGVIDRDNHTIAIAAPAATNITGIASTFTTHDPNAVVKISTTKQVSGTTTNNWTSGTAKTYKVTSGSESQDWDVTITVAAS